jgi:hypothetical protein
MMYQLCLAALRATLAHDSLASIWSANLGGPPAVLEARDLAPIRVLAASSHIQSVIASCGRPFEVAAAFSMATGTARINWI